MLLLLLKSRDARSLVLVVVDRTIDRHQHLHFVRYGVVAGIDRRQVGVCLSLSLVSDVDGLLSPAVPHATLVGAVLRHDKLVAV